MAQNNIWWQQQTTGSQPAFGAQPTFGAQPAFGAQSTFGSANVSGTGSAFSQNFIYNQPFKNRAEFKLTNAKPGDSISDISISSKGDRIAVSTWGNQLYIFQKTKNQNGVLTYEVKDQFIQPTVVIDDPYPEYMGISRCVLHENALFFATVSGHIKSTDKFTETVKTEDIGTHSHLITGLKIYNQNHLASCSLDCKVRIWDIRSSKLCLSTECAAGERCVALDVMQYSLFVATDNFKLYRLDVRLPQNPTAIDRSTAMQINDMTKTHGKMITCFSIVKTKAQYKYIIGTAGGCLQVVKEGSKENTHFWPNSTQTQTAEPITAVAVCDKYAIYGCKTVSKMGMTHQATYTVGRFDTINAVKFATFKGDPNLHKFQAPITALRLDKDEKGYYAATGNDLENFPPQSEDPPHLYYVQGYQ